VRGTNASATPHTGNSSLPSPSSISAPLKASSPRTADGNCFSVNVRGGVGGVDVTTFAEDVHLPRDRFERLRVGFFSPRVVVEREKVFLWFDQIFRCYFLFRFGGATACAGERGWDELFVPPVNFRA
jgi:hypothetical protein